MKFNLKLHQLCDENSLRPAMEHISFQNGKIIASDAHVLVVIDMDDLIITDEERVILDGKFLHRKGFAKIWNKEVVIREDGLMCKSEHVLVPWSQEDFKYPDWSSIVPSLDKKDETQMPAIGLNSKILHKLYYAFPCISGKRGQFELYLTDASSPIVVFNEPDSLKSFAIVMPLMMTAFYPKWNKKNQIFENKKK